MKIKGITRKSLDKALFRHQENEVSEKIFSKLKPYGITFTLALKFYKKWGGETLDKLAENPYQIIPKFNERWDTAESLADYFKTSYDAPERLQASVYQALYKHMKDGYTTVNKWTLIDDAYRFLSAKPVPTSFITQTLLDMETEGSIIFEEEDVTLSSYDVYERQIASRIRTINKPRTLTAAELKEIPKLIKEFEEKEEITLALKQQEAIYASVENRVSLLEALEVVRQPLSKQSSFV